jgi:hypothetical protein
MGKRQRNKKQDMNLAYKGMIPWSRDEFNWIEAEFHRLRDQKGGKKTPGIHVEKNGFDNLLLLMKIFQGRYSNEVEHMANFIRHQQLLGFLSEHKNGLIQEGLIKEEGASTIYHTVLIDTLCFLPLSQEKLGPHGDKIYTFSYSEVVNTAKPRLNAHWN